MKRLVILLVAILVALPLSNVSASPGGLDSKGGHTCRSNCAKYGLKDGEYHYHNADGSIRKATSPSTPAATNTLSVYINGVKQSYDQPPVVENGRTLVPLRGIFESLGATVNYNATTKTIDATKGNTKVHLKIGSRNTKINEKSVLLDVMPQIKNNRTLVPLRFVGEALGATVHYDGVNKTVKITSAAVNNSTSYKTFDAAVVGHTDGDTIKLAINGKTESVRLLLVDTPETVHPQLGVQPFGKEASNFVKELMPIGKVVQVELDVSERDKYGRVLAYLHVDGKMVNKLLLEKGLARVAYIYAPNTRYVDEFQAVQRKAQEQGIGIWSIENYVTDDGFKS